MPVPLLLLMPTSSLFSVINFQAMIHWGSGGSIPYVQYQDRLALVAVPLSVRPQVLLRDREERCET